MPAQHIPYVLWCPKIIMGKRFAGGETGDRKSFYGAPGLSVLRCKAQFTDFKYLIYE